MTKKKNNLNADVGVLTNVCFSLKVPKSYFVVGQKTNDGGKNYKNIVTLNLFQGLLPNP